MLTDDPPSLRRRNPHVPGRALRNRWSEAPAVRRRYPCVCECKKARPRCHEVPTKKTSPRVAARGLIGGAKQKSLGKEAPPRTLRQTGWHNLRRSRRRPLLAERPLT